MFRAIIEVVMFLLALALLWWLFWQYVYPLFTNDKKPGWLTEKDEPVKSTESEQPTNHSHAATGQAEPNGPSKTTKKRKPRKPRN